MGESRFDCGGVSSTCVVGQRLHPMRDREQNGIHSLPALGQEVVGVHGSVHVLLVDADGHAHEHVLRALHYGPVDAQEVGSLQRLPVRGGEGAVGMAVEGRFRMQDMCRTRRV